MKQSAARQSWDREAVAPDRRAKARFDIAPRLGYWHKDVGNWIQFRNPSRPADIYVFAWHGERQLGLTDQSDPAQWQFLVVAESKLPKLQKTVGLIALERMASPCGFDELNDAVMADCPNPGRSQGTDPMRPGILGQSDPSDIWMRIPVS